MCPRRTTGIAVIWSCIEWIAARVGGLRAIDMACGEGYGSDLLAASAASVVGVDANPEAHEHARMRYRRPNLRFERELIETFSTPADAVVFLQTIEHLQSPGSALDHFRELVGAGGVVYLSTPNVLTLAPKGAPRSDNPWHVHEYRAHEFEQLCRRHFASVALFGLFHARKLRAHELALRPAGTACTRGWASPSASTTGSPRRSPPPTSRCAPAARPISTRRSTSWRCAGRDLSRGWWRAFVSDSHQRPAGASRALRVRGDLAGAGARKASWRSSCTPTCPTSRASGRGRSGRSGCGRRSPPATCRCWSCWSAGRR